MRRTTLFSLVAMTALAVGAGAAHATGNLFDGWSVSSNSEMQTPVYKGLWFAQDGLRQGAARV